MAANSETVNYNVELPDSKMMFEEDVSKQQNKERTVTFQVREDGNNTRLIANELDQKEAIRYRIDNGTLYVERYTVTA